MRARHLGAVYLPGLGTDDTYSLETLHGTGTHLSLAVNDPSGLRLLEWAWERGARIPHPAA